METQEQVGTAPELRRGGARARRRCGVRMAQPGRMPARGAVARTQRRSVGPASGTRLVAASRANGRSEPRSG